jgi:DNA-binding FadR family transcriptional regulator
VRHAIHRLEDLGLVRVREGATTTVLDPASSTDIRLIQLRMEVVDAESLFQASLESQVLFAIPLLALAQRRISSEEISALNHLIDQLGKDPSPERMRRFRTEYWMCVARATGNPLFEQQVRWWQRLTSKLSRRPRPGFSRNGEPLAGAFRRLTAALRAGEGAVELWLEVLQPLLARFDRRLEEEIQ